MTMIMHVRRPSVTTAITILLVVAISGFLTLGIFTVELRFLSMVKSCARFQKCPSEHNANSTTRVHQPQYAFKASASAPGTIKGIKSPKSPMYMQLREELGDVCEEGDIDRGCYCRKGLNTYPPEIKLLNEEILRMRGCKKRRPDVIIPGSMKSGTTALKAYLELHPAISFPLTELHFANHHLTYEYDAYADVMPYSTPDQIAIEKTAGYFIRIPIAKRLRKAMPDTKFIIILREPINRAVSNYMHMVARNEYHEIHIQENTSAPQYEIKSTFRESVLFPNGGLKVANRLLDSSRYVKYLTQWYNIFPREHILILDGEEFIMDPTPVLQQVEGFLGIDRYFDDTKFYFNETKGFICLRDPFEMCMRSNKGRQHEFVNDDLMKKLQDHFRPFNRQLVKVLGRELSWTNAY
ncbi:heparan sulfate glucosamine 3-O-sulfotransferase 1-like [Lytechinus pictus]|uniref:heparan sulfate glucosamine 3-O-sulfotransferase 1-like n=1 Tax=Lytechinus pictus TaxID=7653 RepID=UPI0030B9B1B8